MKIYWFSCILSNGSWKTANIFDSNFIYKYLTFVYTWVKGEVAGSYMCLGATLPPQFPLRKSLVIGINLTIN
jgi:hypothetical protein